MRISNPRLTATFLLAVGLLGAAGCQEEARSADWYMAHSSEHQAKLSECKKYPSLNETDQNCKNANAAFLTLISAGSVKQPAGDATEGTK